MECSEASRKEVSLGLGGLILSDVGWEPEAALEYSCTSFWCSWSCVLSMGYCRACDPLRSEMGVVKCKKQRKE